MKRIASIMMITFMCITSLFYPSSIYAQDIVQQDNSTILLKYDEAVELALKENIRIKNLPLEKESNNIKFQEGKDDLGDSLYNPQLLALMKIQKREKMSSLVTEKTENLINQSIKSSIKNIFVEITDLKKEIQLKNDLLNNSIKKRNTLAIKFEYGMESKTNLTTMDIQIAQEKKEIEKLDKDLNEKYKELNKLIGRNLFDKYEIEVLSFEYNPIKDTQEDIEFKITRTLSSDVSLWAKEQEFDIERLDIDYFGLNFISGLYSDMQPSVTPYKVLELDSEISSNELEQMKKDIRNAVIDKYNTIKKLENMHDDTVLKLKELEEKKRVLEVAIKAGTAVEQDYLDLMLGIKQTKLGIETIEIKHAILVDIYNTPVLAGASL